MNTRVEYAVNVVYSEDRGGGERLHSGTITTSREKAEMFAAMVDPAIGAGEVVTRTVESTDWIPVVGR